MADGLCVPNAALCQTELLPDPSSLAILACPVKRGTEPGPWWPVVGPARDAGETRCVPTGPYQPAESGEQVASTPFISSEGAAWRTEGAGVTSRMARLRQPRQPGIPKPPSHDRGRPAALAHAFLAHSSLVTTPAQCDAALDAPQGGFMLLNVRGIRSVRRPLRRQPVSPDLAWEAYRQSMVAHGLAAATIEHARFHVPPFLASAQLDDLASLSAEHVEKFTSMRLAAGRSPRSCNDTLSHMKRFMEWAVEQGLIRTNPIRRCRKVLDHGTQFRRALSVDECRRLLSATGPAYSLLWLAYLATGCRRDELRLLQAHEIDRANRLLNLPAGRTKSRTSRAVPIGPVLASRLPDRQPYVFLSIRGQQFKSRNLLHALKRHCRRAGIDPNGVCIHALRKTCASRLIDVCGATVPEVKAVLGHRLSPDITLGYAEACTKGVRAAVERWESVLIGSET